MDSDSWVRMQSAMREMADLYRQTLETFAKFSGCIEHVQTMTSLEQLPAYLEDIQARLAMDKACLVLEAERFEGFVPQGVRAAPAKEIAAAEGLPYIGPAPALPCPGLFGCGEPPPGSCYVRGLPDKYNPGRTVGAIGLFDPDPERFHPDKATDFLDHFCVLLGHAVVTVRDHDQLTRDAVIDQLTGLHNRHYLNRHAPRLIALAHRRGLPLCLLFLDLDRFKPVNDRFGHEAGDAALKEVAERLRREVRGYDILVRLGGDEFVAVLPDASGAEAGGLALRLAELVETIDLDGLLGRETGMRLTLSAGLAVLEPDEDLEGLLHRADKDMYRRKRSNQGDG